MHKNCDYCGKMMDLPKYRIINSKNNYCSQLCKGEWQTSNFIKTKEIEIGTTLKHWLIENYVVKMKTYRQIVKELKINNRSVSMLLNKFNISIRHGSDAIKTQWINNNERKKKNAKFMTEISYGNTQKRLKENIITKRLNEKNLKLISYEVNNGLGYAYYICNICGYEGKVSSSNSTTRGCPVCKESRGERKIRLYLIKNEVHFQRQFTFNDCKYQGLLKFDFAIFNDNKLLFLIEYDGEQHYNSKSFLGGIDEFKKVKLRDNIKNKYCEDNKIGLLRIPYWEHKNIEQILNNEINKYKSLTN